MVWVFRAGLASSPATRGLSGFPRIRLLERIEAGQFPGLGVAGAGARGRAGPTGKLSGTFKELL